MNLDSLRLAVVPSSGVGATRSGLVARFSGVVALIGPGPGQGAVLAACETAKGGQTTGPAAFTELASSGDAPSFCVLLDLGDRVSVFAHGPVEIRAEHAGGVLEVRGGSIGSFSGGVAKAPTAVAVWMRDGVQPSIDADLDLIAGVVPGDALALFGSHAVSPEMFAADRGAVASMAAMAPPGMMAQAPGLAQPVAMAEPAPVFAQPAPVAAAPVFAQPAPVFAQPAPVAAAPAAVEASFAPLSVAPEVAATPVFVAPEHAPVAFVPPAAPPVVAAQPTFRPIALHSEPDPHDHAGHDHAGHAHGDASHTIQMDLPPIPPLPIAGRAAAQAAPAPAPSGPTPVRVRGVMCSRDTPHFNHPDAQYCSVCGIQMLQQTLVLVQGNRPPLGVLVFDNGLSVPLTGNLVIGRDPFDHPLVTSGAAKGVVLVDPDQSISRAHIEVRLVDWDVQLVELGSTNGSAIIDGQGRPIRQLIRDQPVSLNPGTHFSVGNRRGSYETSVRQR